MMGTTHSMCGAAAWVTVANLADLSPAVAVVGAAVAGVAALLPDLDHPSARLARTLPGGTLIARLVARVSGGHRRGTHTILATVLVTLAAWWLVLLIPAVTIGQAPVWAAAVGVGYAAHLVGDCLTPGGCPLLMPLTRRRFSIPLFPTNGVLEHFLVFPAVGVVAVWQSLALVGLA